MQPKELADLKKEPALAAISPRHAERPDAPPGEPQALDASASEASKPLLLVDIDGVISLFANPRDGWPRAPDEGVLHSIEGIPHFLSAKAASHLLDLQEHFQLVWASGWEEKAEEHLPRLLGLPRALPYLRFDRSVGRSNAHWKLEAIEAYAGARPLAWLDDALNQACHEWAEARRSPTLLVQTDPQRGLTSRESEQLKSWALELQAC